MGNVGAHSPSMVELLLRFGADPNSGGKRVDPQSGSHDSSDKEGEEEDELDFADEQKVLTAGENEGDMKITPLHMLCGVALPKSAEERKEVSPDFTRHITTEFPLYRWLKLFLY